MKPYLLVLLSAPKDDDEMRYYLNARDEIMDWIQINPYVYLIRGILHVFGFVRATNYFLKRNQPNFGRTCFLVPLEDYSNSPSEGDELGTIRGYLPRAAWDTYARWSALQIKWEETPVKIVPLHPPLSPPANE